MDVDENGLPKKVFRMAHDQAARVAHPHRVAAVQLAPSKAGLQ